MTADTIKIKKGDIVRHKHRRRSDPDSYGLVLRDPRYCEDVPNGMPRVDILWDFGVVDWFYVDQLIPVVQR